MRTKRFKKEARKNYMGKLITTAAVVAVVAVLSIVGVMANSIPCTVIDGNEIYEFTMMTSDTQEIINKAVSEGMAPLSEKDMIEVKNDAVIVRRALTAVLENNDKFTALDAYYGDTVAEILVRNEIEIEDSDRLTPSADVVINADRTIILETERTFYISADRSYSKHTTNYCTVGAALEELGITLGENDKINMGLEDNLVNGAEIVISRGKNITITEGDSTTEVITYSGKVEEALRAAGVEISHFDMVSPERDAEVTEGMEITVTKAIAKEVTEETELAFETERVETEDLPEGEEIVETTGVNGLKSTTYREIYVQESLYSRTVIEETIVTEPVTEVIIVGVRPKTIYEKAQVSQLPPEQTETQVSAAVNTFVDMYGNEVAYKSVMNGPCTAYCIPGGICSTGVPAQVGVVAVNPNIIPYGTKMYITSGDVVYGYCVAGDTGGFIYTTNVLVDLYYNSEEECVQFGLRDMTIYIIE